MSKTHSLKRPKNLSPWVLFRLSPTLLFKKADSGLIERVRVADRPLICLDYYSRYKYKFAVDIDLLEGLKNGYNMGFTEKGIVEIIKIFTKFQHTTTCVFRSGNCYAYARYLTLENAVDVANALVNLVEYDDMWDTWENLIGKI